jgi:excisionase family DNA binding protein
MPITIWRRHTPNCPHSSKGRDYLKNAPARSGRNWLSDRGALTVKQVAKLTGIGKSTIYELADRNAIPCYRIGSMVRFDPKDVAEWWRGKNSLRPRS